MTSRCERAKKLNIDNCHEDYEEGKEFISALESIIGAFFMALLIVVLARKWMR